MLPSEAFIREWNVTVTVCNSNLFNNGSECVVLCPSLGHRAIGQMKWGVEILYQLRLEKMIGGDAWWPKRTINGSMEDLHVAIHRESTCRVMVQWSCLAENWGLKGITLDLILMAPVVPRWLITFFSDNISSVPTKQIGTVFLTNLHRDRSWKQIVSNHASSLYKTGNL